MAENYIYYNYNNYLYFEKGKDLVKQADIYFKDARRIMNAQLSRFKSLQKAKYNNISQKLPELNNLDNLYKTIDNNPNFLKDIDDQAMQSFQINDAGEKIVNFELSEFEKLISQADNELNVLAKGVQKLNEAISTVVSPEQMQDFMKASFKTWFDNAKASGAITKQWSQSRAARQLVTDFINKNYSQNKFFSLPKGDFGISNIDQRYAKIASLLYSIQLIHNEGQGTKLLQSINVQSGGKTITGSSGKDLATLFAQQSSGLIVNVKESSHIAAAGVAGIQALAKTSEELNKIKWDYQPIGNKNIHVSVIEKEDHAFTQIKAFSKKNSNIEKKVSKGDIVYSITKDNITVDVFKATLKTNLTAVPGMNGVITHEIKLHDTTNLLHFLRRESGLNAAQFNSLMQLLAGHGDDDRIQSPNKTSYSTGDLIRAWETIKEGIKYNSALNVISGFGRGDFAEFAIIGDRIISVEHILNQITNEINSAGTGSALDIKYIGEVDKNHYTASWVSGRNKPWLQRSTDAWVGLGQLEAVQVQVKLLVNNTRALLKF